MGQAFNIRPDELVDCMVNEGGILKGAFSLRLIRSTMSEEEKKVFDKHVGVSKYV